MSSGIVFMTCSACTTIPVPGLPGAGGAQAKFQASQSFPIEGNIDPCDALGALFLTYDGLTEVFPPDQFPFNAPETAQKEVSDKGVMVLKNSITYKEEEDQGEARPMIIGHAVTESKRLLLSFNWYIEYQLALKFSGAQLDIISNAESIGVSKLDPERKEKPALINSDIFAEYFQNYTRKVYDIVSGRFQQNVNAASQPGFFQGTALQEIKSGLDSERQRVGMPPLECSNNLATTVASNES